MINVDGVAEGHFRENLLGQNLNRFYESPTASDQPELFYIDKILTEIIKNGQKVAIYLDLHGHLNAGGIFVYGNYYPNLEVL